MDSFDFMSEDTANKKEGKHDVIATSGNPGEITEEIAKEARRLAGSPEGLDVAAFQRKYKLHVMNVDEILKG